MVFSRYISILTAGIAKTSQIAFLGLQNRALPSVGFVRANCIETANGSKPLVCY